MSEAPTAPQRLSREALLSAYQRLDAALATLGGARFAGVFFEDWHAGVRDGGVGRWVVAYGGSVRRISFFSADASHDQFAAADSPTWALRAAVPYLPALVGAVLGARRGAFDEYAEREVFDASVRALGQIRGPR